MANKNTVLKCSVVDNLYIGSSCSDGLCIQLTHDSQVANDRSLYINKIIKNLLVHFIILI